MDRRESLKLFLLGTAGTGLALSGCKTEGSSSSAVDAVPELTIGRTAEELERDQALLSKRFFSAHELETVAVLCDIVLPADEVSGSATNAGVPAFIDFIVQDMTHHQTPIRGGLAWLDQESLGRFEKTFAALSDAEQLLIVDDIAFEESDKPGMEAGIKFFERFRNLVLTGFYTTEIGLKDLGYVGNSPNDWDGVPEEVLRQHGVEYDPEWIAKCVNPETRANIAKWDDDGNLMT
ncbi:MAG: gluconate 2-dehydrogenase subunit 3 family protein [Saprospiraceae bacterium]|nr:gluconate 2-dehydrogenase subunit 3 family protein [Saprospiraceae bacterium]